jgi:RNA polymerase sigma factor (sigma-70 family)
MDDAALVEAARSGDRDAWARIYDRYADRLHDYCWSVLRDADDAADATSEAFMTAMQKLHQLRDPSRLRPWLYSIARRHALARGRARTRTAPADVAVLERPTAVGGPEATAEAVELRELVWAAAGGLSDRDRSVLDLHLRQGLEGADLGEAMGTSAANAHVVLSRLRDQVERALGAYLVAHTDRDRCAELDGLLSGWDGTFTPLWRKRIARHVDDCDVCGERRRAAVNPLALLAAAPLVPAPMSLRKKVLDQLELVSSTHTRERSSLRLALAGVAITTAGVALVMVALAATEGSDPTTEAGAVPPSALTVPSTTVLLPPSTTAPVPTSPAQGTITTAPPVVAPTPAGPAPTTTAVGQQDIVVTSANTTLVTDTGSNCSPTTSAISATTRGDPGTPVLHWVNPDGTAGERAMTGGPSEWRSTLGPFGQPGSVRWWVTAGGITTPERIVTVRRCGA